VNEIVAYPRSDAAMDYLNGIALLSGDGWVNWREANRWSVYRPGWGAFLGGLALLTGAEPEAMQRLLTFLLAATAPAFMLLILYLYVGSRDLLLAIVAAVVLVVSPFIGWWFERTMISEGPTMLLAILFCLLAIRFCGRLGDWSWRQGLVLGLVGGALSLVREQSRFAVLAVIVLLVLMSATRLRRRLPFFVSLGCGILVLVAPLYLKTSAHLRMPYAGTSYVALYVMLEYTHIGHEVGGGALPEGVELSEREATRLLQQRVGRGLLVGLSRPLEMLRDGFLHFSQYIHGAVGKAVRRPIPPPRLRQPMLVKLVVFYALTAIGLFFAWRRSGPVALTPLIFAAGYILPIVPFGFYSNRFGVPVSWVGLVYAAGALLLFHGARAGADGKGNAARAEPGRITEAIWPGRRFFVAVAVWIALATGVLLWMDYRPLPEVDAERLFADSRSREGLESAGIGGEAGLVEEADSLLNHDAESERLLAGVAVLPLTIAPGDAPVVGPFSRAELPAEDESYAVFYLVSPWKRGDSFRVSQVKLGGGLPAGIRHGEEVLVVRAPDSTESVGENRVFRVEAAAVLPTRWGG
jgi:hypothetical protein